MENAEERNNESMVGDENFDTSCCGGRGILQTMAKCCEGMSGPDDWRAMMAGCMRKCRWFLLIPAIIGIFFLLLGYVLDAEVTRILWMTAAGLVSLAGVFGFLMMSMGKKTCC
ncbi:MAG: hypothetical protein ACYSWO_07675 [Planctomycetota bacterium]|jgi:hypothetical protein